jgi:hypothetical protein
MQDIWNYARESIEKAQTAQKNQADKHRREVDFTVGDMVYLLLKGYNTTRPNKKLDDQQAGPYRITMKVGNAYRLDLPPSMKIHPVFSPDKLRKAATDPLPGQYEDPPQAIEIDGHDEWEVEKIIAVRLHYSKLQYRVKWLGHDDDPEWYPATNFRNSPVCLRDFHTQHPEAPGPPVRLDRWLSAAEREEFESEHVDDGKPVQKGTISKPAKKVRQMK